MTCPTDCNAPVVGYIYLYTSNWDLRYRRKPEPGVYIHDDYSRTFDSILLFIRDLVLLYG